MNELESRLEKLQRSQADRQLGSDLREEAVAKLCCGLCDYESTLPLGKHASWMALLEEERTSPVPGVSAGAAALVMLEAHDGWRQRKAE